MIHRLSIEDLGSHPRTEIELGRLTLLVGPNSSGKTSALRALAWLSLSANSLIDFRRVFVGAFSPDAVCRRGATAFAVHADGSSSESGPYRVSLKASKIGGEWIPEIALLSGGEEVREDPRRGEGLTPDHSAVRLACLESLSSLQFLRLDPDKLAGPSRRAMMAGADRAPRMLWDGEGLATVLASLKLSEDPRLPRILESVRSVIPSVQALKVRVVQMWAGEGQEETGHELLVDFSNAKEIPGRLVSTGTLLCIGLVTAIYSSPGLLLLDDLEHALHPQAQRQLVNTLRRMLEEHPQLQVVATTHSPYIVDELDPKDVWVFAHREDGGTVAKRLADHPRAEKALEVLTTGEFWSAEGERWVAKS